MVGDLDLGTYFRRTPSGNLIVGGTEPECDPLEWPDDPDTFVPTVTTSVYESHACHRRRLPAH